MKLKLKIVVVLLVVQLAVACTAQTTHVTVAYSLYTACFRGMLQAQSTRAHGSTNHETIKSINDVCIDWTRIWYPVFAG